MSTLKTYRVHMYMDVTVSDEAGIPEAVDMELDEEHVQVDCGLYITSYELTGEEIDLDKVDIDRKEIEAHMEARPTPYAGYTNEALFDMCKENNVQYPHTIDPLINRMRMIMALRSAKILN